MNTATQRLDRWDPNWATHPGEHLEEHLEVRGWSQSEFSRLTGLSKKLVSEIVNCKNPVTPETAIRLERVLGVKAYIWTGLQSARDLYEAKNADEPISDEDQDWLLRQPVNELKKCGIITAPNDRGKTINEILKFLCIGTPSAYGAKIASRPVHHREGKGRGEVLPEYVFAWLMLGEHRARAMDLPSYDKKKFLAAVREIRGLTCEAPEVFAPQMTELCRNAGVALVFQPPFKKTKLFGSARWIDGDRAVIQMSLRMKYNDHFWWTFFHECGHIVLHEGRDFADDQNPDIDEVEAEANTWAYNTLVGETQFEVFVAQKPSTKAEVKNFSQSINLHPGIIVGMLHHKGVLPFNFMNDLRQKYEFA